MPPTAINPIQARQERLFTHDRKLLALVWGQFATIRASKACALTKCRYQERFKDDSLSRSARDLRNLDGHWRPCLSAAISTRRRAGSAGATLARPPPMAVLPLPGGGTFSFRVPLGEASESKRVFARKARHGSDSHKCFSLLRGIMAGNGPQFPGRNLVRSIQPFLSPSVVGRRLPGLDRRAGGVSSGQPWARAT